MFCSSSNTRHGASIFSVSPPTRQAHGQPRPHATTAIRTPPRSPQANAYAERWVRTLRHELLDRTIIWNQQQLEQLLREYVEHYNTQRPHRGIGQRAPNDSGNVTPIGPGHPNDTPPAADSSTNTDRRPDPRATPVSPTSTRPESHRNGQKHDNDQLKSASTNIRHVQTLGLSSRRSRQRECALSRTTSAELSQQ